MDLEVDYKPKLLNNKMKIILKFSSFALFCREDDSIDLEPVSKPSPLDKKMQRNIITLFLCSIMHRE